MEVPKVEVDSAQNGTVLMIRAVQIWNRLPFTISVTLQEGWRGVGKLAGASCKSLFLLAFFCLASFLNQPVLYQLISSFINVFKRLWWNHSSFRITVPPFFLPPHSQSIE
jgi:hypothetical protein